MRGLVLVAACALALLTGSAGAAELAASAQDVRPLLIGAEVPQLLLRAADGSEFDLNGAIAKQPTILIFYRGGW